MAIDVLLIGGGGREHALAWKIAQSPELGTLFAAPGNPGIADHATLIDLDIADHAAVVRSCGERSIGLVMVGPEGPLVDGLADALREAGIPVFGPSAAAAQLEGSKGFTKDLCARQDIPTARYRRFAERDAALDHVRAEGAPIVVKADGLAAGKGVTVAQSVDEALDAVRACFEGGSGAEVVVEECMTGPEVSLFCLCDGTDALPFGTAQDHKRAFDGDKGPNTGGMGAFSPSPLMDAALLDRVMREIVRPTLAGMREAGTPFRGILYAGLMLTPDGPKLVEYNVRFGDPECQVLMPRLASDLLPILLQAATGSVRDMEVHWRDQAAVTVVLASQGYPGAFRSGTPIGALPQADADMILFQAGTRLQDGRLIATGGRVLAATGLGTGIPAAADRAYTLAGRIDWPNGFFRRDIARAVGEGES